MEKHLVTEANMTAVINGAKVTFKVSFNPPIEQRPNLQLVIDNNCPFKVVSFDPITIEIGVKDV